MHNSSVSSSPPFLGFVHEPRTLFLIQTYEHLLLALVVFIAVELVLFQSGIAAEIAQFTPRIHWLPVTAALVLVAWLGREATGQANSPITQYLALFSCVLAEAIIFVPLLFMAEAAATGVIESADVVALLGAISLIALVLGMRNRFVLWRSLLLWWLLSALLFFVARLFFGATPGVSITVMVMSLAGILILCQTATLLQTYTDEQPIPVALELFTALVLPLSTLVATYHYLRRA